MNDKPDLRERVFARGLSYPTNEELLMLMLGSGMKDCPVESLAKKVKDVIDIASREDLIGCLIRIPGVGLGKALSIAAAIEFGRRNAQIFSKRIYSPSDIVPYIEHFGFKTNEHFITLALSGAREILNKKVVAVGGTNRTTINPREIFFEATKTHASAIIIAHNHPSGICTPSNLDIETTKHICTIGELLGITLLDHIILAKEEYFSFSEHGMLN